MSTIKQIAEKAGVSPTTVANVIHGRTARVSPDTLDKVQSILRSEKYAPNMGAVMLVRSNSRMIGVIMFQEPRRNETVLQDPFSSMILGSIEQEIRDAGYFMMLHTTNDEEDVLKLAATWKLAGLILIWVPAEISSVIRRSAQTPIVFVDCFFENDGQTYHNVGLDDERGGYELASYLLSMGHKEVAFFADSDFRLSTAMERFVGCQRSFSERGLSLPKERYNILSKDYDARQATYREMTSRDSPYTALAFFSDYYAAEAIVFCQEWGIDVPGRFSITGFDDNIFARLVRPRLTTVYQDAFLKGHHAVSMLMKLIQGKPVSTTDMRLPIHLKIRDSVRHIPPV